MFVREPHDGAFHCTVQRYLPVGTAHGPQSTDPSAPRRGFHQVHLCGTGNMQPHVPTPPSFITSGQLIVVKLKPRANIPANHRLLMLTVEKK